MTQSQVNQHHSQPNHAAGITLAVEERPQDSPGHNIFIQRALIGAGIIVFLLVIWQTRDVLLVAFAGILLAILLRSMSGWVSYVLPLSTSWALFIVLLMLMIVLVGGVWLLGPSISNQLVQLIDSLPESVARVQQYFGDRGWSNEVFAFIPNLNELTSNKMALVSRATTIFSTTLGLIVNIVVVLFIGIYAAFNPHIYIEGFVRLFPTHRRAQTRQILSETGYTLQRWLVGRLVAMLAIGILTAGGLWLLDIPLALILALLAAVFNFIPYIGPLLSAVPAVLFGLLQSPATALYVALLYLGVQVVESYIFTPLVEQKAVSLPPALTIIGQIMLGVLVGGLGVIFATPLIAAILVIVQMLYMKDTLNRDQSIFRQN